MPFCVTLLLIPVLMVLVRSIYKVYYLISNYAFSLALLSAKDVQWMLAFGIIWVIISLWIITNLFKRNPMLTRFYKASTILFVLFYWIEQLLIFKNPLRGTNWSFLAALSILLTLWIFYILSNNCVKIFFGEVNE
jgi:hypothetical protein